VRTDKGRELMSALKENGLIETRPGDDDPGAVALLHRLAQLSRKRWSQGENPGPRRTPLASI
jgi:coenzyme F420 hydrogenase subunit beta